ncbi:MAG TPA: hypothetical protein VGB30_01665 [bacterium]|jgi:hypothetical protein
MYRLYRYPGIFLSLAILILAAGMADPAYAQRGGRGWMDNGGGESYSSDFTPIPRGEMYDRQFLSDFFTSLGYFPEGLSQVDESETCRLLVTGGSQALQGDTENAITTFGLLPDQISQYFPFLTTIQEDLMVPEVLDPWYENSDARSMMFSLYADGWATHPEYRDNFLAFKEDFMGRAARRDPDVPAVWIMGHISEYGFSPDATHSEDDPYLFLWDLLTGISYYVNKANFYSLQYDQYDEWGYKRAVVQYYGNLIKAAHDEASRLQNSRTFWGSLIDSYYVFEEPDRIPVDETPQVAPVADVTESDTAPAEELEAEPVAVEEETGEEPDRYSYFTPPEEVSDEVAEELGPDVGDIEEKINELMGGIHDIGADEEQPSEEAATAEEQPAEEMNLLETPEEIETPAETEPVAEPEIETPEETVPYEFAPSSEEEPVGELGAYAQARMNEIADELVDHISGLASELGTETIDLVVLYNDVNVSSDAVQNAEARYIAKREALLAGLGVWDRFDMEIYTPLTLAEFNEKIIASLMSPYNDLKSSEIRWAQYEAYEARFVEAFAQIEYGVENRRSEPDVLAAESAALTAFLGDYNDRIKEIEDLLSGAVVTPPPSE